MTSTQSTAHRTSVTWTTARDYRNGGYGDLVAQCSCGSYDYVSSRTEGEYWSSLHIANPTAHGCYLLLHNPMPEGWTLEPATTPSIPSAPKGVRTWTCPTCEGHGSVAAYGSHGGHFYQFGSQAKCDPCDGSGRVHVYPQCV
jgi:hypothetical protein